jgi:hypothetical protein
MLPQPLVLKLFWKGEEMNSGIQRTKGLRPHISISSAVWRIIAPISDINTDHDALRESLTSLLRAVHVAVAKSKGIEKIPIPFRANINRNGETMKLSLTLQNISVLKSKRQPTVVVSLPEEHVF